MKEKLKELTDNQLIDVYVNYKKYNYSDDISNEALKLIKKRKIIKDKL
jgi:hypothetical protein